MKDYACVMRVCNRKIQLSLGVQEGIHEEVTVKAETQVGSIELKGGVVWW